MRAFRAALACVLATLALPRLCPAQEPQRPGWVEDFTVLSANVLVGAVSAGAVQKARGGSFRDGFARGAAGGAGVYAGKRIAAERWAGAGLVGRQVASVGSSVVWNAGHGRRSFDEVALPLGPVRFYVRPLGGGPRVRARVDALALASTVYAVSRPELEWNPGRSLSAGSMVFDAPSHEMFVDGGPVGGLAYPGTIFLGVTGFADPGETVATFAHERVHNLQADQLYFAAGRPLQEWVAEHLPLVRILSRWFDVDLSVFGIAALATVIDQHDRRPWEMEASALADP
ncbi:MAG TPA: hypothetical protein VGB92_25290 [Longimicrobium sp.]|jgi:hypothetical protein